MMSQKIAVSQLVSDHWAMEPNRLEVFINKIIQPCSAVQPFSGGEPKPAYRVDKDGTAHIEIRGVMLKQVPWILSWFGIQATSTSDTRAALQGALNDPDVGAIQLDIDSPGGQVQGTQELAEDVYRAQSSKPITAVVSDTAASAAYWVASQTEKITANRGALVGSIGVYAVMYDASKMAEDMGVKVHVIRSAELKGVGADPGEALTDKQLESIQREVDALAALFVEEVARGRDASVADIKKSATGEVWLADEAKARGLVDQVGAMADEEDDEDEDEDEEKKDQPPEDKDAPPSGPDEEDDEEEEEDPDKPKKKVTAPSGASTPRKEGPMDPKSNAPDQKGTDAGVSPDKARADAALAQLAELRRRSCMNTIEAAVKAGRVLPPARQHVKAYAESVGWDAERLQAFLDDAFATRLTNPDQASVTPEKENVDSGSAADAEVARLEEWLGIPDDAREKYADAAMVTPTGKLLDENGKEIVR